MGLPPKMGTAFGSVADWRREGGRGASGFKVMPYFFKHIPFLPTPKVPSSVYSAIREGGA